MELSGKELESIVGVAMAEFWEIIYPQLPESMSRERKAYLYNRAKTYTVRKMAETRASTWE